MLKSKFKLIFLTLTPMKSDAIITCNFIDAAFRKEKVLPNFPQTHHLICRIGKVALQMMPKFLIEQMLMILMETNIERKMGLGLVEFEIAA